MRYPNSKGEFYPDADGKFVCDAPGCFGRADVAGHYCDKCLQRVMGLARNSDPDTSHAAAESIETTELEAIVLASLRKAGPGTTEELSERTGMRLWTLSPRLRPLCNKGFVARAGKKKNKSGRSAIVWAAVK